MAEIKLSLPGIEQTVTPLPRALQAGTRGAGAAADPFVGARVITTKRVFDLSRVSRAAQAAETTATIADTDILALETEDGTTLFTRTDALREEAARLYPKAVGPGGELRLDELRERDAASRGLGSWLWARVSVLELSPDEIFDAATHQARDLAHQWFGDAVADHLPAREELSPSYIGTRALMWAIESRLQLPGLCRWDARLGAAGLQAVDTRQLAADAAGGKAMLLFIHGTGSNTVGSFGDLSQSPELAALQRTFGEHIYAFEHRTFSESPLENALALAQALPENADLSVATHSRGGLVGDLLALASLSPAQVRSWRRAPLPGRAEHPSRLRERAALEQQERDLLEQLRGELQRKRLRIRRYVRVACPARGTRLLGGNFDVFLSALLSLVGLTLPSSLLYSAVKRVVLEVARNRTNAELVPGIEAMLPQSPLATLLATAQRQQGVDMAVIAGDIEGRNLWKRIAAMFTDWMFFDRYDNDLVVDTDSMFEGLARSDATRYLFDQGPDVSHFKYFENPRSRRALCDWLTTAQPEALNEFEPLEARDALAQRELGAAGETRSRSADTLRSERPVVFVLPGIMGSHLELRAADQAPGSGDRVWFDPLGLAGGALSELAWDAQPAGKQVGAEAVFDSAYGPLCRYLGNWYEVVPFPYDWRLPLRVEAQRLAEAIDAALARTAQPIRLLAHSMGGLLARTMMQRHSATWNNIVARSGGRLIMLGTPNNGSHLMVEVLLGKGDTPRQLAQLDLRHDLQEILDIIASFRGALQLLPRPGFVDAAAQQRPNYYLPALWNELKEKVFDNSFGDHVSALPQPAALDQAGTLWADLSTNTVPNPERVAYVFGLAPNTPCGITERDGRVQMLGTPRGDGSVSWASGTLDNLPSERCWYMRARHGDLANTEESFAALVDLLDHGTTEKMERNAPVSRGAAGEPVAYDAGPTPYPSEEELARGLMGGKPRAMRRGAARTLELAVHAMDLRFAAFPVVCGHYISDAISGAEAQLDRYVVDGALSKRERLGLYANQVGTSTIVVAPAEERGEGQEQSAAQFARGALILGLGEYGALNIAALAETVRAGVLRYLLSRFEHLGTQDATRPPITLGLAPLLIGHNSTTHITIDDSVAAIVRGVCEANQQFADAMGPSLRIGRIEFVELYLDTAISAAHSLERLNERMARDLRRLKTRLEITRELMRGTGCRDRLEEVSGGFGYWPRLIVTGATANDAAAASPLYSVADATSPPDVTAPSRPPALLKFVFLSERARAEAVEQQSQPGLIETLVEQATRHTNYQPDLSRLLFQLMVPLDFKAAARQTERLALVLDGYTANLPWEMLLADELPLVVQTAMVRQLASPRFRAQVRTTVGKRAYVIGNPSTAGFGLSFPLPGVALRKDPPSLQSAADEADKVSEQLQQFGYEVERAMPDSAAVDVLGKLFKQPYRLLHIAAHGIYNAHGRDGQLRSGVILSDGLLLTAAEVGQLEVVPELVFLNCCHLGKTDVLPGDNHRIAYSLSRELIEMGVRCVVAAGWEVDDAAALAFAERFYAGMLARRESFGTAVFEARKLVFDSYPSCNTWGAYQAYGDPGYVIDPQNGSAESRDAWTPVAPEELVAAMGQLTTEARATFRPGNSGPERVGQGKRFAAGTIDQRIAQFQRLIGKAPRAWQDLPDVQYELGRFHAELGPQHFATARAAYLRAIAEEDRRGRVPACAIEQLANLEARTAITAARDDPKQLAASERLITNAVRRIEALIDLSDAQSGGSPNAERWAILGSARKHKAWLQAQRKQIKWADVEPLLRAARDAYACGEGSPEANSFSAYNAINRLQLEGLLRSTADQTAALTLIERAAGVARDAYVLSRQFFDAVMPVDAGVAQYLIARSVTQHEAELLQGYRRAGALLLVSRREFDSTVQQLHLLADLLRLRGDASARSDAQALRRIAGSLEQSSNAESLSD